MKFTTTALCLLGVASVNAFAPVSPSSMSSSSSSMATISSPRRTSSSRMSPLFMDLTKFPRQIYTDIETPIEPMTNLSKELGGKVNLFIKRDDMLGLTGGGNKTRKLEFVMAQAIKDGYDTIVTCGAVQSNHCRLTLSACNKENIKCHLVMEERVPGSYNENATGNNYLFKLLGAESIVPVGLGEAPSKMEQVAEELRSQGKKVLIVPGGASNEIGATGYCSCAAEIQVRTYIKRI